MHIPPPLIAVIYIVLMFVFSWLVPALSIDIAAQKTIGFLILVAGVGLVVLAGGRFFMAQTTVLPNKIEESSTLVTEGIYQYSRNPMYLGMALAIAGAGIGGGSLLMPIAVAGFVWIINKVQIAPEEVGLAKIFGAEYEAYCAQVRRWI